eukprot:scaffold278242_cov20-Prasinocladus_malaysianus.AAC.3
MTLCCQEEALSRCLARRKKYDSYDSNRTCPSTRTVPQKLGTKSLQERTDDNLVTKYCYR